MKKLVIISSMLLCLVFLSGCNQQQARQTQPISSTEKNKPTSSIPGAQKSEIDDSSLKNKTPIFPNPNKVFAPNHKNLYYQLDSSRQTVNVYLEKDKQFNMIIKDVPIGGASGIMPEFLRTSDPNIILLSMGEADSGGWYKNNYYINIKNISVVTISSRGSAEPVIEVMDSYKLNAKISISIENKCSVSVGDRFECKNSGNASLNDLTLNDKKINALKEPKILSCFDPGGLGGCYKESIQLEYQGISKDMGKVFFYFIGKRQDGEKITNLWQENFSFNIKNQTIAQEEPNNLLD